MPLNGLSKELVGVATSARFWTGEVLRQRTVESAVVVRGRQRSNAREEDGRCAIVSVVVAWPSWGWSEVGNDLTF
jgi:hypothetical protein